MGNDTSKKAASKKAAPAPGAPAILALGKLRKAMTVNAKRQAVLTKRATSELVEAKRKKTAGDRPGALRHARRRKLLLAQRAQLEGAHATLEQQCFGIESAAATADAVRAMKDGADAQKRLAGAACADDVQDLVEDVQAGLDAAAEVNDLLAEPLLGDAEGDDELEEEYAALVSGEAGAEGEEAAPAPAPAVGVRGAGGAEQLPAFPPAPCHALPGEGRALSAERDADEAPAAAVAVSLQA